MLLPLDEAEEIFRAEKTLLRPFRWDTASKSGRNQSCLECRISISNALPRGVFFRVIAYPRFLDSFTFQLDCERAESRAHIALYRLEVKPFRAHRNKFIGPEELHGEAFPAGVTHEHDFHDSLTGVQGLSGNSCVQARPIFNDVADFSTALTFVCSRLNIVNGTKIPTPPSQGDLF